MKSDLYLKKYVMDIENSGVRPVKIFIHMYKYSHKVDSVHPDIVLLLGDTLHQSSNQLLQSQL